MFESYTIKDIAKALGLSTSTVSRALNGSYEIGTETKKLVLEYAEKINYRPNPIALSLKEQKSHSIGVVVCEVANNYFSQAINGIESIAYNRGYHVIITQTHESAAREASNMEHLLSRHVDGLLISLSAETTDLAKFHYLHDKGFPIVFFDRVPAEIDTHKVTINNYQSSYEATLELIKIGYTKIAHITNSQNLLISQERVDGYKKALEEHQIPFRPEYLKHCNHGGMIQEEVDVAVSELMGLRNKPEALFSTSDRLTTGGVYSLKRLGLKIPEDVALAGFTNSDVAELFSPPLTVVRQPAFQMGQMATEMLINMIESKRPVTEFKTEQLSTELILRESSVKVK
jgi:LacI family transcriptional regulator